ncbi:transporter [Undibacterium sp. FT147W]|uniref:Transporter n=1 Tax=Undibacterium rivi TaxID=2828729 RepID=A0ABS5H0R1_9BURK|nr:OmpP1/FadL family transporter [Undibacterium rivi]MBR7792285.1 transporter [Undibacterium rivi]
MKPKFLTLTIATTLGLASLSSHASGYRFGSQSVSAQSTAEANGAEAIDASTIFANPAGLSRLEGTQIIGGVTAVIPQSSFTDSGSRRFTGTSSGGLTNQDSYTPGVVAAPSLYVSRKINDQWVAGFGLFVPYGSKLDYDNNWSGRYAMTNIKLESINLNPSVSFKVNEQHSFGFGVSAQLIKANLGQGVDVPGSIAALAGTPASAALLRAIVTAGGNPATLASVKDGHGSMDGEDWGYGWNFGYLFQLDENTRFGLAYRSPISHSLTGSAVWDFNVTTDAVVNKIIAANSGKNNSAVLLSIRTPETFSINGFRQIDPKWAVMADATWTRTSRLKNLNIQFPGTVQGDEVILQNWKNTWRFSVGTSYKLDEKFTLRGGVAYDQSPVAGNTLRHPALPDANRVQLSFGTNWKLNSNSSVDLAYSYLHFQNASGSYKNSCSPLISGCTGNGELTQGTWKTSLHMIGAAYNYRF